MFSCFYLKISGIITCKYLNLCDLQKVLVSALRSQVAKNGQIQIRVKTGSLQKLFNQINYFKLELSSVMIKQKLVT